MIKTYTVISILTLAYKYKKQHTETQRHTQIDIHTVTRTHMQSHTLKIRGNAEKVSAQSTFKNLSK